MSFMALHESQDPSQAERHNDKSIRKKSFVLLRITLLYQDTLDIWFQKIAWNVTLAIHQTQM
jgi:hypothetical protein